MQKNAEKLIVSQDLLEEDETEFFVTIFESDPEPVFIETDATSYASIINTPFPESETPHQDNSQYNDDEDDESQTENYNKSNRAEDSISFLEETETYIAKDISKLNEEITEAWQGWQIYF